MSRWLRLLAITGLLLAPSATAGEPAKPREPAELSVEEKTAVWETRLAGSQARIEKARAELASREGSLTRARHRNYPRGEALEALIDSVESARRELEAAEAELPELLERARRDGVAAGVLQRYERVE